jgi:hypothetical protein
MLVADLSFVISAKLNTQPRELPQEVAVKEIQRLSEPRASRPLEGTQR